MPDNVEEKVISLRIFMPESLRNHFKSVCARQGKNMSEVVTEFVSNYVTEYDSSLIQKDKEVA